MERKFGALESPKDLRDFRVCSTITKVDLPTEYKLAKELTIKDQGNVNSCVAHSLSSMLEEKFDDNFSTGFIYGYRPSGYYQGEGMYPREALKTLLNKGDTKNKEFDVNVEMPEAKYRVEDKLDILEVLAERYRITAYARLYSENEIKSWLYTKNIAVPIAIATDNIKLDSDNIIQIPEVYPNSGHALLIIGWDEKGFIIQNSWGKDWGDNGKAILPYEYNIREAWGVSIDIDTDLNNKDMKKPTFNICRSLIMFIVKFIKILFEGGK